MLSCVPVDQNDAHFLYPSQQSIQYPFHHSQSTLNKHGIFPKWWWYHLWQYCNFEELGVVQPKNVTFTWLKIFGNQINLRCPVNFSLMFLSIFPPSFPPPPPSLYIVCVCVCVCVLLRWAHSEPFQWINCCNNETCVRIWWRKWWTINV